LFYVSFAGLGIGIGLQRAGLGLSTAALGLEGAGLGLVTTDLDYNTDYGDKWSVTYDPLKVTGHKSVF